MKFKFQKQTCRKFGNNFVCFSWCFFAFLVFCFVFFFLLICFVVGRHITLLLLISYFDGKDIYTNVSRYLSALGTAIRSKLFGQPLLERVSLFIFYATLDRADAISYRLDSQKKHKIALLKILQRWLCKNNTDNCAP